MGHKPEEPSDTMALSVPETFHTNAPKKPKPQAQAVHWRLPLHHQETLRDIAQGEEESDVGLCCTYLVDQFSGEGGDYDEHALNALEAYAESAITFRWLADMFGHAIVNSWRENIRRGRRAINRLREHGNQQAANVLMCFYGHPDPIINQLHGLKTLGKLANLARYTDVVEGHRYTLVAKMAADPSRRFVDVVDVRVPRVDGQVISMVRYRDRVAWADQTVTSGDALREALKPFGEPTITPVPGESMRDAGQRREARSRRQSEHAGHVHRFIARVENEASAMLSRAEAAYHQAWLSSKWAPGAAIGDTRKPHRIYVNRVEPAPFDEDVRVRGAGYSST